MCIMLEVFAAVGKLAARRLRKEKLSIVAERVFGVVCLKGKQISVSCMKRDSRKCMKGE